MSDTNNLQNTTASDADLGVVLTKEDLTIDPKDPNVKSQLLKLKKLIDAAERTLDSAKDVMEALIERKDYKQMPGIEGKYDGKYIVTASGEKHEVPSNYAAKSRLVYGDGLKIVEEEGKKVFKQIDKVARKNLEGVVTKKEGKWHVLTEAGSHVLLDRAVEFNDVKLNDLVDVVLPESNLTAPFAAFNKVVKSETPAAAKVVSTEKSATTAKKAPAQSFKGVPSSPLAKKPSSSVDTAKAEPAPRARSAAVSKPKPTETVVKPFVRTNPTPKPVAPKEAPAVEIKSIEDLDDLR